MRIETRRAVNYYLELQYPFHAHVDPDLRGYVIVYPDLPGCLTQVEEMDEIPAMAEEVRRLWIEMEYERGHDIPLPTYPEEYSGKFNVRLPRTLHHALAGAAARDGTSLNQYVATLLARGDAQRRVEDRLAVIEERLAIKEAASGRARVAEEGVAYDADGPRRSGTHATGDASTSARKKPSPVLRRAKPKRAANPKKAGLA